MAVLGIPRAMTNREVTRNWNVKASICTVRSIQEKIRYPERARSRGVEGSVIVKFVVDEQGRVVDPVVERGLGFGCDEEALRVVREVRFKPGRQRGRPVKVQQSLTFTFSLR